VAGESKYTRILYSKHHAVRQSNARDKQRKSKQVWSFFILGVLLLAYALPQGMSSMRVELNEIRCSGKPPIAVINNQTEITERE